jgi:hypothetical protein
VRQIGQQGDVQPRAVANDRVMAAANAPETGPADNTARFMMAAEAE